MHHTFQKIEEEDNLAAPFLKALYLGYQNPRKTLQEKGIADPNPS